MKRKEMSSKKCFLEKMSAAKALSRDWLIKSIEHRKKEKKDLDMLKDRRNWLKLVLNRL